MPDRQKIVRRLVIHIRLAWREWEGGKYPRQGAANQHYKYKKISILELPYWL
jgi:hypothetical protein